TRYSSTGMTTHPAVWAESGDFSWAKTVAPQTSEAATRQGKNGLRADRLSAETTASVEFFIFNPLLFNPHSNGSGDAQLFPGDVPASSHAEEERAEGRKLRAIFRLGGAFRAPRPGRALGHFHSELQPITNSHLLQPDTSLSF